MDNSKQTVAILGNGVVGIALGKGFADSGWRVVYGTRDANGAKTKEALATVTGASAASYEEASRAASIAVVALPWGGVEPALDANVAKALAGKVVIDASNPLDFSKGAPQLALGFSDSAGETVQRLLPQARVVKAFNVITSAHMVNPKLADGIPDMFIAGNDEAAKRDVTRVLESFGWRKPIDMGDITASRLLEGLAMLWVSYGARNNHWTHGFSLLGQKK